MKRSGTSLPFGLGLFLALMITLGLMPSQVLAESARQNSPCDEILAAAARQAGVKGTPEFANVNDGSFSCSVYYSYYGSDEPTGKLITFLDITPVKVRSEPVYECNPDETCKLTSFHDYPAKLYVLKSKQMSNLYWYVKRGKTAYELNVEERPIGAEGFMSVSEALWSVADQALPGVDENNLLDPIAPITPADPSGKVPDLPEDPPAGDAPLSKDLPKSLGPLATTPFVPLVGALIGTVVGWLISVITVSTGQPKTSIARPSLPKMLVPAKPVSSNPASPVLPDLPPSQFWKDWDNNTPNPPDDPPLKEENYDEMHKYKLDGYQSKDLIMQNYQDDIPVWRHDKIDPQKMHFVDTEAFNKHYVEKNHAANDMEVDGLADPETLEMYIDKDKAMNYAPLHEMMHVSSNKEFCNTLNLAIDEAATDYFTNKIADRNKVPRATYYMINDSVKVVEEMVNQVGEPALRKAFFGEGKQGIDELRYMVDKKIKPGAFDKAVDLMLKGKNLKARALLREKNLAK
jgi:hypothetical protein